MPNKAEPVSKGSLKASSFMNVEVSGMEASNSDERAEQTLATSSPQPSETLKNQFKMVIHGEGRTNIRIARLDTGSEVNVLSEQVVIDLGLPRQKYRGASIQSLGVNVDPVGVVTFEWHVLKRSKTYSTEFCVVDKDRSLKFDALISHKTIEDVGFYRVNTDVWRLDR